MALMYHIYVYDAFDKSMHVRIIKSLRRSMSRFLTRVRTIRVHGIIIMYRHYVGFKVLRITR